MSPQELYDRDFFEWTQVNADLLSRGCFETADIAHIAEELADLGKRNRREVPNAPIASISSWTSITFPAKLTADR
jgi:Domain of unknown function DUF29